MGKKSKVGKERKDKYYELAKKQGYRARSAYKLTQLGGKFNLFDGVSFVLDLCAAPGGWMQVSRQSVPMAGHVFGVDLVPIRPINGCTCIQADITTTRCEKLLDEAFRRIGVPNKLVDLVLHDGAPNVGANWDHDAYAQNELVLRSLQLATKYLKPHGIFVTKVFRGADYTKLLFVFEQLFGHVVPTKPSSSRDVSAELFVVCKEYKAPAKIASAFFDLTKVFEQVEEAVATVHGPAVGKTDLIAKSLLPSIDPTAPAKVGGLRAAMAEKTKARRDGYEPGDDFRCCTVRQFFESTMPAYVLINHHRMEFNKDDELDKAVFEDPSTTPAIKDALRDLKVLGNADLRHLLQWRLKYLKTNMSVKETEPKPTKTVEEDSAEQQLTALLQAEAKAKLKALRKRRAELRRLSEKMQITAAVFGDAAQQEDPLFDAEDSAVLLEATEEGHDRKFAVFSEDEESSAASTSDGDGSDVSEDEDYIVKLEQELNKLHIQAKEHEAILAHQTAVQGKNSTRRQKVFKAWADEMQEFLAGLDKRAKQSCKLGGELVDVDSDDQELPESVKQIPDEVAPDSADSEDEVADVQTAPAEADEPMGEPADAFNDEDSTAAESETFEPLPLPDKKLRQQLRAKETARRETRQQRKAIADEKLLTSLGGQVDGETRAKAQGMAKRTTIGVVAPNIIDSSVDPDWRPETFEEMAEVRALGAQLSKKKTRMDLIDGMYNRYAFADPVKLPDWFSEHDKEARATISPLTKELAAELRAKLHEISERPIRKVLEARARKRARGDKSHRSKRDKTYVVPAGAKREFKARSGKQSGGHVMAVDRRLKADKRVRRRNH